MQQSSTLPNEIVFYFFNYYNTNRTTLLFFRKLSFYANLTCITFYKPTTYIKTCFITYEILQILRSILLHFWKYEVYLQRQTNKECKFEQTKSVSLNNKKAGDFKSHLLHISLANVVVSFLLCKFFVENLSIK